MRLIYWVLGAAATSAAAVVISRVRKSSVGKEFLEALRSAPGPIKADPPSIVAPGVRAETFRGTVAGRPFLFAAKFESADQRWTFALSWEGADVLIETSKSVSEESGKPLQGVYAYLRRQTSEDNDSAN